MSGILNTSGIENFYNAAATNDFARTNLFRVISLGGTRFTSDELLYVTTTTLPARAINNIEVPFMGMKFNVPGTANYPGSGGWNITFRVPANLSIRRKFEDWTKTIFDDSSSTGAYNIPSKDASNLVQMVLIDKQGNPIRTYNLYGAWCQQVGELSLDLTAAGEILTQQATIAYQYWRLSR
jgi:T4-like virus tail tube protein gp19